MVDQQIQSLFVRIGAEIDVRVFDEDPRGRWPQKEFALELTRGFRGERFSLRYVQQRVRVNVIEVRPDAQHLVLGVRRLAEGRTDKFLCGMDERHWFAAAVPGKGVYSVDTAREALMPAPVRFAVEARGLPRHLWYQRRNAVFVRQGEWFFLPVAEQFEPTAWKEPITRTARQRPHLVEEVHRRGGEEVWVCPAHPAGVTPAERRGLLARDRHARTWTWSKMFRDPELYARGTVEHPDHSPLQLGKAWHRVYVNEEHRAPAGVDLVFLD